MFKKFSLDKINGTKQMLFFLSRAPTHDSFTFDSRFLYDYHFRFRFAFNKVFFFFQQEAWTLRL